MKYRMEYDRSDERTTITTDESSGTYSMVGDDARRAARSAEDLVVTGHDHDSVTLRDRRTGKEYMATRDRADSSDVIGIPLGIAFVLCLNDLTHFSFSAPIILLTMPLGFPVGTILIAALGWFAWYCHERILQARRPMLQFCLYVGAMTLVLSLLVILLGLIGWCDPFSGFFETIIAIIELAFVSFTFLSYALLVVYIIRRRWMEVLRYATYILVPLGVFLLLHGAYGWFIHAPDQVFEGYYPFTPMSTLMDRLTVLDLDWLFTFLSEGVFRGSMAAMCITGVVICAVLAVSYANNIDGVLRKKLQGK